MVHQRCHDKIAEEQKAISINERQQLSWRSIHHVTYGKKFRMNEQCEQKKKTRVKEIKAKNTAGFSSSGRTKFYLSTFTQKYTYTHIHACTHTHAHTHRQGIHAFVQKKKHRPPNIHTVSWQPVLNWMELVQSV